MPPASPKRSRSPSLGRANDALVRLNSSERQTILMHFYEGLTLRQMADQLGISKKARKSESTVPWLISAAASTENPSNLSAIQRRRFCRHLLAPAKPPLRGRTHRTCPNRGQICHCPRRFLRWPSSWPMASLSHSRPRPPQAACYASPADPGTAGHRPHRHSPRPRPAQRR